MPRVFASTACCSEDPCRVCAALTEPGRRSASQWRASLLLIADALDVVEPEASRVRDRARRLAVRLRLLSEGLVRRH